MKQISSTAIIVIVLVVGAVIFAALWVFDRDQERKDNQLTLDKNHHQELEMAKLNKKGLSGVVDAVGKFAGGFAKGADIIPS